MVSLASGLLKVPYLILMLIKFSSAISRVSSLKTDTADSPRLIIHDVNVSNQKTVLYIELHHKDFI
jgi:hypothetical protein